MSHPFYYLAVMTNFNIAAATAATGLQVIPGGPIGFS
jgi:hypothetical protein